MAWGIAPDTTGAAFRDAARAAGQSANGVTAIRVMWPSLSDMIGDCPPGGADLSRLRAGFGRLRFVHLSRTDRVAQAVSRLRAEQTGLWHRFVEGEEQVGRRQRARYDAARIATYLAETATEDTCWRAWYLAQNITPDSIS